MPGMEANADRVMPELATLLSKNVGETRKHKFKLENFSAEKQNFIDIVCQITMIKTHKNVLVYGEIEAKYKDYCDRCLQSIIHIYMI